MFLFSNPSISFASSTDIPAIKYLLNSAYRGESAKQGWTHEADLISGNNRTNDSELLELIEHRDSVFLKYTDNAGALVGCVNLQKHGEKIYLGMFSVSPELQGAGIGKQILQASEEHARNLQCASIYMSVISLRDELINWYKRHGYIDTGSKKSFVENEISGKHLQPLEFIILEKFL